MRNRLIYKDSKGISIKAIAIAIIILISAWFFSSATAHADSITATITEEATSQTKTFYTNKHGEPHSLTIICGVSGYYLHDSKFDPKPSPEDGIYERVSKSSYRFSYQEPGKWTIKVTGVLKPIPGPGVGPPPPDISFDVTSVLRYIQVKTEPTGSVYFAIGSENGIVAEVKNSDGGIVDDAGKIEWSISQAIGGFLDPATGNPVATLTTPITQQKTKVILKVKDEAVAGQKATVTVRPHEIPIEEGAAEKAERTVTFGITIFAVEIKAEDGESDPPEYILVGDITKFRAKVLPKELTGNFKWQITKGKKYAEITAGADEQTVSVKGLAPSVTGGKKPKIQKVKIKLMFKPTGATDWFNVDEHEFVVYPNVKLGTLPDVYLEATFPGEGGPSKRTVKPTVSPDTEETRNLLDFASSDKEKADVEYDPKTNTLTITGTAKSKDREDVTITVKFKVDGTVLDTDTISVYRAEWCYSVGGEGFREDEDKQLPVILTWELLFQIVTQFKKEGVSFVCAGLPVLEERQRPDGTWTPPSSLRETNAGGQVKDSHTIIGLDPQGRPVWLKPGDVIEQGQRIKVGDRVLGTFRLRWVHVTQFSSYHTITREN